MTNPMPVIQIDRCSPLKNPLEVMTAADDPLPWFKHDRNIRVFSAVSLRQRLVMSCFPLIDGRSESGQSGDVVL